MMDNDGRSELEVLEERFRHHIQTLDNIYDQSGFYRECLAWNEFKTMIPGLPELPLTCDGPNLDDSMKQIRHCHLEKTPGLDKWMEDADYNCGLRVAPSEKWEERNAAYRMERIPRGYCIIIGNLEFESGNEERKRCMEDVQCTKRLFSALHFDCIVSLNLKAREINELLTWVAKPETQKDADCLVVVLMSHGLEGCIYGVDNEKVDLYTDVYERFNNENCPALQGKPKLFFVQACRGRESSCGAPAAANAAGDFPTPNDSSGSRDGAAASQRPDRTASWSDMYIVYATIRNYTALRSELTGSWLLSAVAEVFKENAHVKSLDWLMRRVHEVTLNRVSYDGGRQTPCTEQLGWTKKLFFYPGRKC